MLLSVGHSPDAKDVKELAANILKEYSSTYNQYDTEAILTHLFKYLHDNEGDKSVQEEALRLFDRIGRENAAAQLGVSYCTLSVWRNIISPAPAFHAFPTCSPET